MISPPESNKQNEVTQESPVKGGYQLPLDQGNDMSHENPSVGSVSEEPANAEPSKASSLT